MGILDRIDEAMSLAKATADIAKSGGSSSTAIVDLNERLLTLRENLIAARQDAVALQEEKLELEKRLADLARFEEERDQYVMMTLSTGSVVYVLRGTRKGKKSVEQPVSESSRRGDQGPVYFCANCFEQHRRSILQPTKQDFHKDTYSCQQCGSTALIPNDRQPFIGTVPIKKTRMLW